ncbi:MAG TPA: ComEA family DNA-binding protein [Gemmatimonadaceae bacterium]|nr:ComEA family DNA-binding protein [Gemmatimonadaceae bacterium]
MPTSAERKSLVFLSVVALLGGGVRVMRAHEVPPPSASATRALDARIAAVRDTGGARRPKRKPIGITPRITVVVHHTPPDPAHRVDVDRATAAELQALPGIGPALAARIVANRDSLGPFGSLAALRRVKGIGEAKARKLDSLVTFSGVPRP